MTRQFTLGFIACALALASASSSRAGTIIGVESVSGGGNAVINPILTEAPNNDNNSIPFEGNVAVISKLFNANEPIDIVFEVDNSTGITEYHIAEGMANVSGFELIAYAFELGFGTGTSFVRSVAADGLDFDTPNIDPGPTSGRFTTMAHTEDLVRFTMGTVPNGMTDAFTVSIDVPDYDPTLMPASAALAEGYRFTLRQVPIVPEPGTIGIVILSALAWAVFTLRRRWG
jgi:hypothetical protein